MALISIPNIFSVGAVIVASQHNSNFSIIYSDYNGNITDANISASAAIADTKLATISTAAKVNVSALTPAGSYMFAGMIVLWSGTIATIPSGWVLCNGSNSTPDLRNLFVVGANADSGGVAKSTITGSALQTGGSTTITTGNLPASGLSYTVAADNGGSNSTTSFLGRSGSALGTFTGTTGNMGSGTAYTQPFYALAYIMKT